VALLVSIMAMLMMLALGAGVTLNTITETTIAANHRDGLQALYAAEAGIEVAVSHLRTLSDWRAVADAGAPLVQASFVDLLQSATIQTRIDVVVSVSADPGGDEHVLVLQSRADGPGAIRRNVQVTIRRVPAADEGGPPVIETLSWR
jgi:Tfp pilus assembly protein PilX